MLIFCLAAFFGGLFTFYLIHRLKTGGFDQLAKEILQAAEREADKLETAHALSLKDKEFAHQRELDAKSAKLHARDQKIAEGEKRLEQIAKREAALIDLEKHEALITKKLEGVASLTKDEAKAELMQIAEHESTRKIAAAMKEAEKSCETQATKLIATAINRLALPTVSEGTVVTVALPSQEIKRRVIGREGRNIRALEHTTGVSFMIDDTPNAVVISGFDPVRKEVARRALKELIQDGRIHPTRIEEVVERTKENVSAHIITYGQEAAEKAGVLGLAPELHELLGQLNFRFSFGQNVLTHSIEVSHLMGLMAAELGLNEALARRIGLLHDMGKAAPPELGSSHALVGRDLALRYGESEAVANGIGCHHEEILPATIEGSLTSAADTLSGARPGARIEALDHYLKRAQKLEEISQKFPGVESAYALQAGREVRVIVEPKRFDEAATLVLARTIAKKIEKELSYPGKIKVTVIRETRSVEYAT